MIKDVWFRLDWGSGDELRVWPRRNTADPLRFQRPNHRNVPQCCAGRFNGAKTSIPSRPRRPDACEGRAGDAVETNAVPAGCDPSCRRRTNRRRFRRDRCSRYFREPPCFVVRHRRTFVGACARPNGSVEQRQSGRKKKKDLIGKPVFGTGRHLFLVVPLTGKDSRLDRTNIPSWGRGTGAGESTPRWGP